MVSVSASVNLLLHHNDKVQKFWHRLTRVVPEKRTVKRLWCGGVVNAKTKMQCFVVRGEH